jgi:hypothetical protein
MAFIGIDYSIRYPSMCILKDDGSLSFYSAISDKLSKKKQEFLEYACNACPGINITYVPNEEKSGVYCEDERLKTQRAALSSNELVHWMERDIPNDSKIIAMEGIAYGAKGSSLVDICISTGVFRGMLVENYGLHSFYVFTPSELKNVIGAKGNATKAVIFDKFIDMEGNECGLKSMLKTNIESPYVMKKEIIESPWNDMIDAYLAVMKLRSYLENNK